VTVVRDDVAPQINVTQPDGRSAVYTDSEQLRGRTEPGATVTITDARSSKEVDTTVHEDGRFSAVVPLRLGANQFILRSADPAGNHSTTRVTITRAASDARLTLTVSPEEVARSELPVTISMAATVRDETGRLVDGAAITFSVSPPDSSTVTYRVTTAGGRARWNDLTLESGDSSGVWLVTVLATLPSGAELREDGSFSLE
jgi:hypothetical protein